MIGTIPGASASKAESDLMDRMLDAAFEADGDAVVVAGDVSTGRITIETI